MSVLLHPKLSSVPEGDLLDAVEARMRALVEEQGGGVVGDMVLEHLDGGGKRLRAHLALGAAEALGVNPALAVGWAAACELMHNASLVHDDLQDGDAVRRGRPALWARYGAGQAINAGDLMLMLPTLAVGTLPVDDGVRWRLAACLARHGARTVHGQAEEMSLRDRAIVSFDTYRAAARGKTAGLFGMPVEGAALLRGASADEARRLAGPFEDLGLAYQMLDDVVDLYGDKGRGERGGDVREGKISALVSMHLEHHAEDRLWITAILRTDREATTVDDVERVTARFRDTGTVARVLAEVDALAARVDEPALRTPPAMVELARLLRARLLAPRGGLHA